MTKPLARQRSLSSASGGGVGRDTPNSRPSLQTSKEYVARAQQFADARVHETLHQYHSNRAAASYAPGGGSPGVDRSQWKLAKGGGRHGAIACYKKVSSRGPFGGLRLRAKHGRQQQQQHADDAVRMTMSAKNVPSVAVSEQAELLALGSVPGTLEDVLHGSVNLTPEAMQIESAHAQCDLLDSRVLAALVAPSASAPFRSLTLKWALRHHEVLSRHRDYVYLEATGVLRDPQDSGARVGYHLVHSVTLPSAPELAPEMQIVRGHLSYCYLYRQHSENDVELFFHGGMLPRGGAKDRLAFSLTAETVLASPSTIECAMMKKLAFSLRTKQPAALRPPSPPLHHHLDDDIRQTQGRKSNFASSMFRASMTFDSNRSSVSFGSGGAGVNPCRVCHRPVRAFFGGKVTRCELCEEPVCNHCKVNKKVFVFKGGVFHPQKMEFCSECMLSTSRLNAGWVASQELTGATTRMRMSERISLAVEEHGAKPQVGLGSSWNGGMSRIDESRATMSSDGPMVHSAPQSVVWLPTDHLHPRLTSIDPMDMEEEEDNEDEHPNNAGPETEGYPSKYDRVEDDSFIDTEAFVTLDDDDEYFDGEDIIPMIDIPSEGEEDDFEGERVLSRHVVDLV
ncbi:Zinc finger, RING/FYVE/PHD-type [Phytophthora cinnamomi]|uniref:Zinc finger, RING/FYVE/PHD-type n=1 Tax=Phytophthora cinnamomi TaxID=4785 RepID=UPI00355A4C50|nr:Zinc finger, RING/FYVE/PHD-type [Phytophthora cinnamomi]